MALNLKEIIEGMSGKRVRQILNENMQATVDEAAAVAAAAVGTIRGEFDGLTSKVARFMGSVVKAEDANQIGVWYVMGQTGYPGGVLAYSKAMGTQTVTQTLISPSSPIYDASGAIYAWEAKPCILVRQLLNGGWSTWQIVGEDKMKEVEAKIVDLAQKIANKADADKVAELEKRVASKYSLAFTELENGEKENAKYIDENGSLQTAGTAFRVSNWIDIEGASSLSWASLVTTSYVCKIYLYKSDKSPISGSKNRTGTFNAADLTDAKYARLCYLGSTQGATDDNTFVSFVKAGSFLDLSEMIENCREQASIELNNTKEELNRSIQSNTDAIKEEKNKWDSVEEHRFTQLENGKKTASAYLDENGEMQSGGAAYRVSEKINAEGCSSIEWASTASLSTSSKIALYDEHDACIYHSTNKTGNITKNDIASIGSIKYARLTFLDAARGATDENTFVIVSKENSLQNVYDEIDSVKKEKTPNGYMEVFQVSVNHKLPNNNDITENYQDGENMLDVDSAIYLPTTYKNHGRPTKLLIFCHGAGSYHLPNDTSVAQDFVCYALAQGYAVLSSKGISEEYANYDILHKQGTKDCRTNHVACNYAIQAYYKSYKYVIEKYNIDKDVFLMGGSMGGLMSMTLANSGLFSISAMLLDAPVLDIHRDAYYSGAWGANGDYVTDSVRATRCQIAYLYGFDDFNIENHTISVADGEIDWNTATNAQWEELYAKNAYRLVGHNPFDDNRFIVGNSLPVLSVRAAKPADSTFKVKVLDGASSIVYTSPEVYIGYSDNTISIKELGGTLWMVINGIQFTKSSMRLIIVSLDDVEYSHIDCNIETIGDEKNIVVKPDVFAYYETKKYGIHAPCPIKVVMGQNDSVNQPCIAVKFVERLRNGGTIAELRFAPTNQHVLGNWGTEDVTINGYTYKTIGAEIIQWFKRWE